MKKAIFGLLLVVHSTSTQEVKKEKKHQYNTKKPGAENGTQERTLAEVHLSLYILPGLSKEF